MNKASEGCEDGPDRHLTVEDANGGNEVGSDIKQLETIPGVDDQGRREDNPVHGTTGEAHKVLDGGWGWYVVLGCMLGHFFLVGLARSIGVLYICLKEKFQQSDAATSWVQSLFNTLRMVTGPLVSMLCDRFSSRKVVMVGGLIFGAGCVMSAFATSLLYLNFSFGVVAGLGGSLTFTPMFIMINQYFDKRKGLAMSLATMGSGLGTIVLAALQAFLLEEYGYFGTFLVVGALAFHTCVSGALYRPAESKLNWIGKRERPSSDNEELGSLVRNDRDASGSPGDLPTGSVKESCVDQREDVEFESGEEKRDLKTTDEREARDTCIADGAMPDVTEEEESAAVKRSCLRGCGERLALFRSTTYWLYAFNMAALPCGVQIVVLFMPIAMKAHGMTTAQGALSLAVSGAADMVGRIVWGLIFDIKSVRHRRRPLHHCLGLLMSLSVLLLAFQSSLAGFLAVGVMWGLFEGGWHAQRATIGAEIVPKEQMSNSMGYMILFQGIGNLIWPTLAGFVKDVSGTYSWCFVLGSCYIFLTSVALLLDYIVGIRRMRKAKGNDDSRKQDIA